MCQRKNNFDPNNISCSLLTENTRPLLDDFSCGNSFIDRFFKDQALHNTEHTTHIFWDAENERAIAAVSFACSSLNSLYGGVSVCDCQPAVEITYFAVDKRYQKLLVSNDKEDGYVSDLIMALSLSLIYDFTALFCAACAVILYSTENAEHFYERNHFIRADVSQYWRKHSTAIDDCIFMYQEL